MNEIIKKAYDCIITKNTERLEFFLYWAMILVQVRTFLQILKIIQRLIYIKNMKLNQSICINTMLQVNNGNICITLIILMIKHIKTKMLKDLKRCFHRVKMCKINSRNLTPKKIIYFS